MEHEECCEGLYLVCYHPPFPASGHIHKSCSRNCSFLNLFAWNLNLKVYVKLCAESKSCHGNILSKWSSHCLYKLQSYSYIKLVQITQNPHINKCSFGITEDYISNAVSSIGDFVLHQSNSFLLSWTFLQVIHVVVSSL